MPSLEALIAFAATMAVSAFIPGPAMLCDLVKIID